MLDLKINEYESIAILGESGCGKSTFTNLLLRFYDIDSEEILIDGVNI
jgi:ABC-type multidrug transport system fused ATPase/permease subunit